MHFQLRDIQIDFSGLQKYKNYSTMGLFGNHSPGKANYALKDADLVVSLGASLLQHQTLKIKNIYFQNFT